MICQYQKDGHVLIFDLISSAMNLHLEVWIFRSHWMYGTKRGALHFLIYSGKSHADLNMSASRTQWHFIMFSFKMVTGTL